MNEVAAETLTVVVPCLNEETAVADTVESILATAPQLDIGLQIFLVDDGSTDETARAMERLCAEHPRCRMHVNPTNLGLGRTVLATYDRIEDGHWVTVVPGDNEFVFSSIRYHLAVRHDYDVLLGCL